MTLSARAAHFLDTYQQCKASASQKKRSAGPASTQLRRVMVVRAFTSPCATHTNNTKTKTQVYRDAFPRRKGPREKKKGHTRCCIVHTTLRYDATAKSSAENAKKEKDEKTQEEEIVRGQPACVCATFLCSKTLSLSFSLTLFLCLDISQNRARCVKWSDLYRTMQTVPISCCRSRSRPSCRKTSFVSLLRVLCFGFLFVLPLSCLRVAKTWTLPAAAMFLCQRYHRL